MIDDSKKCQCNYLEQKLSDFQGRLHLLQCRMDELGFPKRILWGTDFDGNEDWVTVKFESQFDNLVKELIDLRKNKNK